MGSYKVLVRGWPNDTDPGPAWSHPLGPFKTLKEAFFLGDHPLGLVLTV